MDAGGRTKPGAFAEKVRMRQSNYGQDISSDTPVVLERLNLTDVTHHPVRPEPVEGPFLLR